jgi:uncharacterized protein with von Willebrand factor type A (vWA) domain
MDTPATFTNALLRARPELPVRLKTEYIVTHRTRNTPECASAVLLDVCGSMRYDEQYVNVKRMGLALSGLVRGECPATSYSSSRGTPSPGRGTSRRSRPCCTSR